MNDILTELLVQEIRSQLKIIARGNTDIVIVLDLVRLVSISMDMKLSTNVIPSTHQTPPLRMPVLSIPPLCSRLYIHSAKNS